MDQERRKDRLELAQLWADLVSKLLGALALVAAGVWTYTNFTVERTHDPTMQVDIEPAVHEVPGGKMLLNVDVMLQNVGRVAITPKFPHEATDSDLGLEISIVQMDALPDDATSTEAPWFDWTDGAGQPRTLLSKKNLLATNEDFRHGRYQLNPGVKYREPFACLVEKNKLYAIRARFWTDEGSIADLVYVHTYTSGEPPLDLVRQPPPALIREPLPLPAPESEPIERANRGNLLRLK